MISRRKFILTTTASAVVWPMSARARQPGEARLFRHGVASGDPLTDRVILWTRVTAPQTRSATGPIDVRWILADDEGLTRVVARGTTNASPDRDFTVKVDAGELQPGRTYYYAFDAGGERSPVGRTKTLPPRGVQQLRFASVSCSNYPAGYFNVYRCIANRPDLDAVIHLGDYIYEFANGQYGDGTASGRVPQRPGEAITLEDYRSRYASYRSDIDLQECHRQHPFIVVWDDHELANDAWSGGAANHDPSEGDWQTRRLGAYRAYLEWMPIREAREPGIRLYREFNFGDMADLVMIDTRVARDRQLPTADAAAINDPKRTMLGSEQEAWFFGQLRDSQRAGRTWRLIGQEVLFSSLIPPGARVQNADMWDGYPAARGRVLDMISENKISDVVILTGDLHSSWAFDVPRRPWGGSNSDNGGGAESLAVELVTPAISSPPLFADSTLRERAGLVRLAARHLKYLEGESRGYVLLDITAKRMQAEWYFVPTVNERTDRETKAVGFVCERGSSRLTQA